MLSMLMRKVILASSNRHKLREVAEIIPAGLQLACLADLDDWQPPEETGVSFAENAALKALAASKQFSGLIVADDSGLEVDVLDGAPGVRSARYAGDTANDEANRRHLMAELQRLGAVLPAARFRCVIAVACDGRQLGEFQGVVEGTICELERGEHGFGYDSLFIPDGYSMTFAEMPSAQKNSLSHRGRALAALADSGLLSL